jgi:hypothetical protein
MMKRASLTAVAAVLCVGLNSPPAAFQGTKSATVAKELTQALDAAKLDAIAAADPTDPSAFVAALYIQGSQLLVVSAKYAAPSLLTAKIKTKEFRDIYMDLASASITGSKVFIIDQRCDGLVARPDNDNAADTWEAGPQQVTFDGEWRKAKLTEDAYGKVFSDADERYTKILTLLAAQAKQ